MSSVSKPRVRQNRHKQGLNQTLEKISADFRIDFQKIFDVRYLGLITTSKKNGIKKKNLKLKKEKYQGKNTWYYLQWGMIEKKEKSIKKRIKKS